MTAAATDTALTTARLVARADLAPADVAAMHALLACFRLSDTSHSTVDLLCMRGGGAGRSGSAVRDRHTAFPEIRAIGRAERAAW